MSEMRGTFSRRDEVKTHLYVHVVISRYHVSFVLHSPLQPDVDLLASEICEERFRVDRLKQTKSTNEETD